MNRPRSGRQRLGRRLRMPATIAAIIIGLGGCEGVQLYDKSRADVSAAVKKNYEAADVLGVIAVQAANLDALHKEDLKVVEENLQLQRDYSLLQMVDSDEAMSITWEEDIQKRAIALGFVTDDKVDLKAHRDFISASVDQIPLRSGQINWLRKKIQKATNEEVPACTNNVELSEDDLVLNSGIPDGKKRLAVKRFKLLIKACNNLKAERGNAELSTGKIKSAKHQWRKALLQLNTRRAEAEKAKAELASLKDDHEKTVKALKDASKADDKVKDTLKKYVKKIDEVAKAAPQLLANERINALVTLLKAAAGEDVKLDANEAELAKAVVLVGDLSSLAGDVSQLIAKAKAPTVSNLLIELQNQVIQSEYAKSLETLQQRRVDSLEARYKAYLEEAELLLSFRDSLCNFATQSGGKGHIGSNCDSFQVDGKACKWTEDGNAEEITDCALAKPWKHFLSNKSKLKGAPGRAFYQGLAAHMRSFPVRATQIQQTAHLVDVKHRENLVRREMALKSWNNLVVVPIEQLDAYYQSGIKPDVIADLIVKALGFTAITVGVSQ